MQTQSITTDFEWKPKDAICHYMFDGDFTDSTGSFGNATGTATFQTLSSGKEVLQTDGTNMVLLPSGITDTSRTVFTIAFFMKVITTSPTYGYYAGCGNENLTNHISFYESTAGRNFVEYPGGNKDITPSGIGMGWRFVCFRSDGINCDMIINGQHKTATSSSPSLFGWNYQFVIGGRSSTATTGTGQRTSIQMGDFVIASSYWSDNECLTVFNTLKSKYGL